MATKFWQSATTRLTSKSALSTFFSNAKYLCILLSLLAVGFAGHGTHWTFGITKHDESEPHSGHPASHESAPLMELVESTPLEWEVSFPTEKSLQRSGVKTIPLEQRSMRQQVKTTGVITYDERMHASLSARVSGTVWRVLKQPGEAIRRGDVLVIIDAVDVGRAKAGFFSDLVDAESKAEILASLEKATGVVPERQVREARVAVREAKIRLQNTEQTLINMGLNVRKTDFEGMNDAQRAAQLHFLGLPASISHELDPLQMTSNLLPLTASFDGVLLHHDAALGEMVEAGKPVLEIADLRRMWLKLDVPKEDAAKLATGQSVRFLPDGLNQELNSTINWISTEMNEQTRTLRVRCEVENPLVTNESGTAGQEVRMLRANTFGIGMITLQETPSAFVVPAAAILHEDHQPMIFAETGELRFSRRDVKLGIREGDWVQIESDSLHPGLEVVTKGCHILKSEWVLNHVAAATP